MVPARFVFDLNSPYAYLAEERVDAVVSSEVTWEPIVFGALLRAQERVPWSMRSGDREAGVAEVQRRANQRGLPPVKWPEGWPRESYSVAALRAATWALGRDRTLGRALTRAMFRAMFVHGWPLSDPEVVGGAAASVGIEAAQLARALADRAVKHALRVSTAAAIGAGVPGVPTLIVGDELFWGDDRLEDAAAADAKRQVSPSAGDD